MTIFKNISFEKLKKGLAKTKDSLLTRISETISRKASLDEDAVNEIEEILITSDIGVKTSELIIEKTRSMLLNEPDRSLENINRIIKNELITILSNVNSNHDFNFLSYKPYIILIIGVNGSGKTTTIGKLAHNFKMAGLSVVIGSADTFRAAANDQLEIWSKRAGVEIVKPTSHDPSAVAYDTIATAKRNKTDIVLIDTAGRLHTQKNLMEELGKIKKVIKNSISYAPNDIFLVLDGSAGQNALYQVNEFEKYTDITGLIVTKLDGTAKGGIVFQICLEKNIPVKFVGIGEEIDDLQQFDSSSFVNAIFS